MSSEAAALPAPADAHVQLHEAGVEELHQENARLKREINVLKLQLAARKVMRKPGDPPSRSVSSLDVLSEGKHDADKEPEIDDESVHSAAHLITCGIRGEFGPGLLAQSTLRRHPDFRDSTERSRCRLATFDSSESPGPVGRVRVLTAFIPHFSVYQRWALKPIAALYALLPFWERPFWCYRHECLPVRLPLGLLVLSASAGRCSAFWLELHPRGWVSGARALVFAGTLRLCRGSDLSDRAPGTVLIDNVSGG